MRNKDASVAYFTYDDLQAITDDTRRYEILEGELAVTPAPATRHQIILANLHYVIYGHVQANGLGLALAGPVDVYLDATNVLEPDLLFVARARRSIVKEKYIEGPPDLVVEVVSKGTKKRDLVTKRALYARFGVKHYWILDPFTETLTEITRRGRRTNLRVVRGNKTFRSHCFPDLAIELAAIWAR